MMSARDKKNKANFGKSAAPHSTLFNKWHLLFFLIIKAIYIYRRISE